MTNEPVNEFTEDVARQIVAVKNDPIAKRDFMVLATRIKDAKQEGKAEERRETALKMLRKQKPLSEIMEFASITEEDIRKLAKEKGFEVV